MSDPLEDHLRSQIRVSNELFWHRLRWDAVSSYLPSEESFELVDVGAGAGRLGDHLAERFARARYRFVEPIASLRSSLVERFGAGADATDDRSFGGARFVTLLDVLEHQYDDVRFLEELVAKLDPGTTLILTVPALERLWSNWDVALGHHRRYDKAALLTCFRDLPLAVREVTYLFPELVPLGLVRASRNRATSELPELARPLNSALYQVGRASLALRRHWRTGTSLFLVATLRAEAS